jgi:hypothetical protein
MTHETLAKALHEAGREAVAKRATVAHSALGVQTNNFIEWDDLTLEAREGRFIQAGWLLERFDITPKLEVSR